MVLHGAEQRPVQEAQGEDHREGNGFKESVSFARDNVGRLLGKWVLGNRFPDGFSSLFFGLRAKLCVLLRLRLVPF